MKKIIYFLLLIGGGLCLFLFLTKNNNFSVSDVSKITGQEIVVAEKEVAQDPNADLPPQGKLQNLPAVIKAIYFTGWSGGSNKKIDYLIGLTKTTELNAVVIDVKDYTGQISYKTSIEAVNKYSNGELKILKPNALIKKLHDNGIYVIGRMAVFQDQSLSKGRPDLALQSISKSKVWTDYKGISWMDQSSKEVWDYNIAIAKDALSRGFDEINFDYIRFASDGNMADIRYPFYNYKTQTKRQVMNSFFKYLRENLPGEKLSADLFGYTTIHQDDLGIGQHLDDAFPYFDYIAPMVYPSHYNKGFNGYANPALYPYDVVHYSMLEADKRLKEFNESTTTIKMANVQFRPWLQDFNLGATYDIVKVKAQIQAVYDAASTTQAAELSSQGWMLWNPSNIYTKDALLPE
jgi:hypothetical protein